MPSVSRQSSFEQNQVAAQSAVETHGVPPSFGAPASAIIAPALPPLGSPLLPPSPPAPPPVRPPTPAVVEPPASTPASAGAYSTTSLALQLIAARHTMSAGSTARLIAAPSA